MTKRYKDPFFGELDRTADNAFGKSRGGYSGYPHNVSFDGHSLKRSGGGNNQNNDTRVDVYIHKPPEEHYHYENQTRESRSFSNLTLKQYVLSILFSAALMSFMVFPNQINSAINNTISFVISIIYYIILVISLIIFVKVTLYLEKRGAVRPYSFLGGIVVSAILAITIMTVFGLI